MSGCRSGVLQLVKQSKAESPSIVATPSEVKVSGDAKSPPEIGTKKSEARLPIPEGSKFEFNEKTGQLTLTLSKAVEMAVNRTEMAVKGPVAFDPPKAPSVKEIADAESDGKIKIILYVALVVGAFAGIFGVVRGWNWLAISGGCAAGAAGFCLVLNKSIQDHPWISHVIVAAVVVAVVAVVIYHTKIKKLEKKVVATENDSH